jgi:tRNA-dihydrouridine synthase
METGKKPPPPGITEKVELARLHFTKSLEYKGVIRGILEMRRHFSNYFKCLPDFRELRLKLVTSTDVNEIYELLEIILERYKRFDDC